MSYDIKKVLSNRKESFYRVLPNIYEQTMQGSIGNIAAVLPNANVESFSQERYMQELNPSGHEIFNKSRYPDKWVEEKDEEGNLKTRLFAKEQSHKSMMKILGY